MSTPQRIPQLLRGMALTAALMIFVPACLAASAPSYNCKGAKHDVEILICNTPALHDLDNHMNDVYAQALQAAAQIDSGGFEAVKRLQATQRGWIKGRNDCWKDTHDKERCTAKSYQRRMAYLQARWNLSTPYKKAQIICNDNQSQDVFVTFYQNTTLPAAALEYGDRREIMVAPADERAAESEMTYDGLFGQNLTIKNNGQDIIIRDRFQVENHCVYTTH